MSEQRRLIERDPLQQFYDSSEDLQRVVNDVWVSVLGLDRFRITIMARAAKRFAPTGSSIVQEIVLSTRGDDEAMTARAMSVYDSCVEIAEGGRGEGLAIEYAARLMVASPIVIGAAATEDRMDLIPEGVKQLDDVYNLPYNRMITGVEGVSGLVTRVTALIEGYRDGLGVYR